MTKARELVRDGLMSAGVYWTIVHAVDAWMPGPGLHIPMKIVAILSVLIVVYPWVNGEPTPSEEERGTRR